jgi:zinc protease
VTRRQWLALAGGGAFAAERKGRAPVSHEALVVKIPEAAPVKLANGVTLIALEDSRLPIATINFRTEGAGPIYTAGSGVAELTADMLREGAGGRSGKQIAEEASRLGATLRTYADSGAETAVAEGAGLASGWQQWFELLSTVVMRPTFAADDFSSVRQRWLVNLAARRSQPGTLAYDALLRLTFGDHPAAFAAPPAEALAALTPEKLAAWHRERYKPANTVVFCIGRVRAAAFRAEAEKVLGSWTGPTVNVVLPPEPQDPPKRRIVLIDRPGAAQTEIGLGGLLFERRDPDFFPYSILNAVLGGGTGSRLFQILREEKGYAYQAATNFSPTRFRGFWQARAGVRTDATADALAIMLAQLRRLCDEPISAAELASAKTAVQGWFALNLEQPQQLIVLSYLRYRYGFSADYWERYPAKLNSVSAAEVQAVAQKYLNPDRAHIVAVGDAARIRPALAKLGTVES